MDSNLLRLFEEIGTGTGTEPIIREDLASKMQTLISYLKHGDARILKQTITCGTVLIGRVLQEITFQINSSGKIEKWLEVIWNSMVQFKDYVPAILSEPGPVSTKVTVLKFLETCVLLFTPEKEQQGLFNISQLSGLGLYSTIINPAILESDAIKALNLLLDILHNSDSHRGALIITAINCLVSIAKKRPVHYDRITSELINFDSNIEFINGAHNSSIKYNLRVAFSGFLKSTNPTIIESRDRLMKALRILSPGESTEQLIRQIEKRYFRPNKEDQSQAIEDLSLKKRNIPPSLSDDPPLKRARSEKDKPEKDKTDNNLKTTTSSEKDNSSTNYLSEKDKNGDDSLSPAGKMIAVIGALIAEGERGVGPLELLIKNIHADLMADIVIETMHKFNNNNININVVNNNKSFTDPRKAQNVSNPGLVQNNNLANLSSDPRKNFSLPSAQTISQANLISDPRKTVPLMENLSDAGEAKRDPRRDPRRMDPRRPIGPNVQLSIDTPLPPPPPFLIKPEQKLELHIESPKIINEIKNEETELEASRSTLLPPPPVLTFVDQEDQDENKEYNNNNNKEEDNKESEMTGGELPVFPVCLEMSEKEERESRVLAVKRIFEGLERERGERGNESCLHLISRMVSQNDPDDEMLEQLKKHISFDYYRHQGHELAINVLYHLEANIISDPESSDPTRYEKFLISLARTLIETLPSTDKSFGKLLNEAPLLPESIFNLLEELCTNTTTTTNNNNNNKEREIMEGGERMTQGLGTVWSLILGRPNARLACLNIALKCAIHSQDEVRSKAIRLVANKLYLLSYASEKIEEFAKDKFFSIVNNEQTLEIEENSISSSQNSDSLLSPKLNTLLEAQNQLSLFFALCSKKPSLLKIVFDVYGKAPKAAKQAIHRHIPVLLRNIGSCSELIDIIYNLPEGSENLIILVLQVLTEESTPSADLITAVKHLYFTKLKDPVILIPMLSSLSKEEVLPIFAKLVDLPLEKFQAALARILQGSAHTGPALTPAEVLIAIHDINPEKDGVALKKVTDACTACFQQRTVFTQQVLAKALNQMVEKVPLPLLFMRTVIQTIGAFPTLVDFVMGILSKLVSKQIWRMPKLYAGFLKCVYQTQPHSFPVLLQLPGAQLENVLTKHQNIKGPLASHVINNNLHTSLPRQTLVVLGLITEPQQTTPPTPFDSSNASIQA